MNIIIFFSLILMAVSAIFSSIRQLQMLQQNSYYPSRYFSWLKSSFTVELAILSILFCFSSLLYNAERFLIQLLLAAAVLIIRIPLALKEHRKSIKKLVFTARIKRLIATQSITAVILILLYAFFYGSLISEICLMIMFMIGLVSPIWIFICWGINYPIEKSISRWYINDAKKILKNHKNLTVIGITGSYGKTTTKFILNRILSEKYNTVCTPQSFNTPLGVVRTVRGSIKPQTQMFVCEMGAKNVGDIKEICDIAHPDYGIITSVGAQHLETFKSIDNVFKTKFELADSVKAKGGKTFVSLESAEIAARADFSDTSIVSFGENSNYYADNITYGRDGTAFTLHLDDAVFDLKTSLLGRHSVCDIVAAAAMAHILGVSIEDIRFAVKSLKPTEHRLELKSFKSGLLIDDAYNANPEGSLEAVRVLSRFDGMKKTIITPGLVELGDKEYDCNYALGLEAAKYCDIIILVGKNRAKPMLDAIATTDFPSENVFVVSSFAEAMSVYTPLADKDSIVLLENDLPDNYLN